MALAANAIISFGAIFVDTKTTWPNATSTLFFNLNSIAQYLRKMFDVLSIE